MHKWSPQQEAVFKWFERSKKGNLVVTALAGCGKTTTICEGVRRAPETLKLVAAFNKRIAVELEERVKDDPFTTAKTLHGVGFDLIRQNTRGFQVRVVSDRGEKLAAHVCDGSGADKEVIKMVAKLAGLGKQIYPQAKSANPLLKLADDFDINPDEALVKSGYGVDFIAQRAYDAMEVAVDIERDMSIDFDDMLYIPLRAKLARGGYEMVVIDEAQDMNPAQLLLAMRVCNTSGRIVVVGDPNQAIYSFRGADSTSIARLKTALKAEELNLTVTYRCPKNVVKIAQNIVPAFTAHETAPDGTVVAGGIATLLKEAQEKDFILSRLNAPLMTVCIMLIREGKKARIEGRDIGKGLLTLMRRFSRRSVEAFLEDLDAWEETQTKRALARKQTARMTQVAEQAEMFRVLAEEAGEVYDIESKINELFVDLGGRTDFVVCSTVHKAKGLEAERVFVLTDTLYPKGVTQEEKNLEYVAVTRSKSHLYLIEGVGKPRKRKEE